MARIPPLLEERLRRVLFSRVAQRKSFTRNSSIVPGFIHFGVCLRSGNDGNTVLWIVCDYFISFGSRTKIVGDLGYGDSGTRIADSRAEDLQKVV